MENSPPTTDSRSAIVAGAGIGGLATALALRNDGWEVEVWERAERLDPLGAGLALWPNAVLALRALGVADAIVGPHTPRGEAALRDAHGTLLASTSPRVFEDRYGAPLVVVHRATLQDALRDALGADRIRLGREIASVEPDGVVVGAGGGGATARAQVVVAADGIHSTVRRSLGLAGPLRPSGLAAVRAVVPWSAPVPSGEWWGRGVAFGMAQLSGEEVYWYCAAHDALETLDGPGLRGWLAEAAGGFAEPVGALVQATPDARLLVHRLEDREPALPWGTGRVTAVGDAAHPILPFLGQGACCALEDAVALAAALTDTGAGDDAEPALRAYERARLPRAQKLFQGSRRAAKVATARSRLGGAARNALVRNGPSSVRMRQFDDAIGPAAGT